MKVKRIRKDILFYALLCLYLFYYSYRYVFRYNFTGTSPTYSDTPILFQITKYLILFFFILCLFTVIKARIFLKYNNRYLSTALFIFIVQFLLFGIICNNSEPISIALLCVPCLFFLSNKQVISLEIVEKIFIVFWWYSTIYEGIQIVLYFTIGRLPALAYATGRITDVRFGGAWDDPNGYALLMIFYIFYFLFKYPYKKMILYVVVSSVMLLLTWSGTGYISFILTSILLVLINVNDKKLISKYSYFTLLSFILLAVILALYHSSIYDAIKYFFLHKQESIGQHGESWNMSKLSVLTFLGVKPDFIGGEVGFIRIVSIGGVPALVLFLMIVFFTCSQFKILAKKNGYYKPLMYGAMAYSIAFLLFEFNLPNITSFSCMGVFSVFISIAGNVSIKTIDLQTNKQTIVKKEY